MSIFSILHSSKKLPPPDKTGLLLPAVREVQSVIETYTNIDFCKAIIHPDWFWGSRNYQSPELYETLYPLLWAAKREE